jgi:hypothetical protein
MSESKIIELEKQIKNLEERIGSACILLWDYDGYYNPHKKTGDPVALASLIDEVFVILQGKHWTHLPEPMPEEHHDIEE